MGRPSVRSIAFGIAAIALVGLAGPASAARPAARSEPPAWTNPTLEARVPQLAADQMAEGLGISQAEARRRIASQVPYSELATWAHDKYQDTFAGTWYDQEHGGTFHMASTDTDDLAAMVDEAYSRGLPLVGSVAARSEADLEALTERISAGEDPDVHAVSFNTYADLVTNTVVISVDAADVASARAALQAAGRTDITVKAGAPFVAAA
jgi:hypothetical protein